MQQLLRHNTFGLVYLENILLVISNKFFYKTSEKLFKTSNQVKYRFEIQSQNIFYTID